LISFWILKARDIWKKKYFTEKKKTPLLEENVNGLLNEIQTYQNKIIHALDSEVKNAANDDQKKDTDLKVNFQSNFYKY